jgi:putative membrane protein
MNRIDDKEETFMFRPSEHYSSKRSWLFHSHDIPFKQNWPLQIMIAVFVIVWVLTAINPLDWKDWLLESILPVLLIGALAFLYRSFPFNNVSYLLITVFLILHVIGAHYTYQHTPVDTLIKHIFHTKRGFYDRIVHLAFGLLLVYPMREVAVRAMKLRSVWSYIVTCAVIFACSAFFEIIEMLVALIVKSQLGAKYLGLQGDPLDTQKDMSMALTGALLSVGLMRWYRYFSTSKDGVRRDS